MYKKETHYIFLTFYLVEGVEYPHELFAIKNWAQLLFAAPSFSVLSILHSVTQAEKIGAAFTTPIQA